MVHIIYIYTTVANGGGSSDFFDCIALMVKLRLHLGIIIIEREKVKRKLCVEVHWFWFSSTVTERREYCQLIHFMVLCFWKSAER